jgi:hypothetical protein
VLARSSRLTRTSCGLAGSTRAPIRSPRISTRIVRLVPMVRPPRPPAWSTYQLHAALRCLLEDHRPNRQNPHYSPFVDQPIRNCVWACEVNHRTVMLRVSRRDKPPLNPSWILLDS